ncbi:MAG: metal-dependent hydrolase [Polyangiaceae bacterium]|nr:metal-dependent hydrolase [Polyangiaceae bacterium]
MLHVRDLRFQLDDVPRDWHGGQVAISSFFDNLSLFFPAGERFFVAAVRAHRHSVSDPEVAEAVRVFCAQEGIHGREHARYNEQLRRHGYPAQEMERRVARLLRRVSRVTPRRWRLAATCALEHFTALMAHLLLSNPRLLEGAHPQMAALWRWHAAEENEHKAVAFDVYQSAGGGYLERTGVMIAATVIFWAKVLEHQLRLMHSSGTLWSWREHWSLIRFLLLEPGGMGQLVWLYLDYFRPGFHPWDLDNRELLEAWRREVQRTGLQPPAGA